MVPPLTAFYMFLWPQIVRSWEARAFPTFRFSTDAEGWGSFVTNNFWRNLPGPGIIALTFLVCGFAMIYLLGSRTFCTYVCPYGAIFALADRIAVGRIRVNENCQQCGTCTAACTCGIRVHEEVKQHGMIVNPACLKDLDCVAACPQSALRYTFTRPSLLKSLKSGGRFGRLPYDFSLGEELLIGLVFVVVLLAFRGLYAKIPFLLSLGLGGILGYFAVLAVRLFTRPNVRLATLHLKELGRVTWLGRIFGVLAVVLTAFVGHSGFVRYHEYRGLRQTMALGSAEDSDVADAVAANAYAHLTKSDEWGLFRNERLERAMLGLASHLRRFDEVEGYALRLIERRPDDVGLRVQLGQAYFGQERFAEAGRVFREVLVRAGGDATTAPPAVAAAHQALGELLVRRGDYTSAADEFRSVLAVDPDRAEAHAELGSALAELGRLDEAIASLYTAVRLNPKLAQAHYNLGTILGHQGHFEQAIRCYRRALALSPEDADLQNNLGYALLQAGELDQSRRHLERAVAINPNGADAHFNLATVFRAQRLPNRATEHYRIAAGLDPRYAEILGLSRP
jgi:Tfp pilus assembly protein PilF/ferredoxin